MPRRNSAYDESLALPERRRLGAYYTPAEVVDAILDRIWPTQPKQAFTLLDPACGDGAFLVAAARRISKQERTAADKIRTVKKTIFGIDCDPQAVLLARRKLAVSLAGVRAAQATIGRIEQELVDNFLVADALAEFQFPHGPSTGFSAIVGNPPYVNIRRLTLDPQRVAHYRQRFRTASRAFDLYVLFLERACELLASGGRCGFLVPNKLASLEYARACRELLACETQLEHILDFSRCRLFATASVYPLAIVFRKRQPPEQQVVRIEIRSADHDPGTSDHSNTWTIPQQQLQTAGTWSWENDLQLDQRIPTTPLGELCRLHSGTTGFQAQLMAAALQETGDNATGFDFIVSGNIDRYHVGPGNVRYMKRQFARPLLPVEHPLLTQNKRNLFAGAKIVIAGMSRWLEAAWDAGGFALGVQVFAAAEWSIDSHYLLAILNSSLLSHWYRARFSAKRLAGGYFSVNKGQLACLPIPTGERVRRIQIRLSRLAAQCVQRAESRMPFADLDAEIDALVARLFEMSAAEMKSLALPASPLRCAG